MLANLRGAGIRQAVYDSTYTFIVSIFILIGLGLYQQAVGQIPQSYPDIPVGESLSLFFYIESFLLVVLAPQVQYQMGFSFSNQSGKCPNIALHGYDSGDNVYWYHLFSPRLSHCSRRGTNSGFSVGTTDLREWTSTTLSKLPHC